MQLKRALSAVFLCSIAAVIAAGPFPIPKVHYKALCSIDNKGRVHCVSLDDLNRLLTPAQVEQLLQIADEFFPDGKGRKKNSLVGCGHGDWITADLAIPTSPAPTAGSLPGSAKRALPFPSATEAQAIVSQCRASVQNDFDHAVQDSNSSRTIASSPAGKPSNASPFWQPPTIASIRG